MKKKFFILLTPLLSVNGLFIFLNGCEHRCEKSKCSQYNGATLLATDNADSTAKIPDASGVKAKAFLLLLTVSDTVYQCVQAPYTFHGNCAYAECLGGTTRPDRADSILLTSDHAFDANHPAGTDLKDLFNIRDTTYVHTGRNNFYLLKEPSDTGTHTFTIQIFVHDASASRIITATSLPVKLLL